MRSAYRTRLLAIAEKAVGRQALPPAPLIAFASAPPAPEVIERTLRTGAPVITIRFGDPRKQGDSNEQQE